MSLAQKFALKIQKNATPIRNGCFDYVGGEYDVKYQRTYDVKYQQT